MRHAQICDIGKCRKINQDSVFADSREDMGLFVVADGMGGHSRGEAASRHMINKMAQWWDAFYPEKYHHDFTQMMDALQQAAGQANREIYEEYNKTDICGCTLALLFIYQNAYGILYAGDSRIYLYCRWKFRQLTTDEVWENQPGLTPQERKQNWERCHGRLYNAAGVHREMQCSVITDALKPGTAFLLCSDGLYKFCPRQYLKKCLKRAGREKHLDASAQELLDRVYEGEAKDNISIILVEV